MVQCSVCENEIVGKGDCEACSDFTKEKSLKRKIGICISIFFSILVILSIIALINGNRYFHRFSFCISMAMLGLSLRAYYFIPLLKKKPEKITPEHPYKKLDEDEVKINYLVYFIITDRLSPGFSPGQ